MNDWLSHIEEDLRHDTSRILYQKLKAHPWRTLDPREASLFVVAIPLRKSLHLDNANHRRNVDEAFSELFKQTSFHRFDGSDHLFLAHFWEFSAWSSLLPQLIPPPCLARLSNVTCTRYEYYGMSKWENLLRTKPQACARPLSLYARPWEPTKHTIVTPHATAANLPIVSPSFGEWGTRVNWIFYHVRRTPFHHGATELRHLPVNRPELFEGCIGHDINREDWLKGWAKSKFALIVRGDTPGTTAFVNAIAAGCIPVIISDGFEKVVMPFKDDLDLAGFSVQIPEEEFLANPERVMPMLRSLPDEILRSKLECLKRAQRLLLYTHPESLSASMILERFQKIDRSPVEACNPTLLPPRFVSPDGLDQFLVEDVFQGARGIFSEILPKNFAFTSQRVTPLLRDWFGWSGHSAENMGELDARSRGEIDLLDIRWSSSQLEDLEGFRGHAWVILTRKLETRTTSQQLNHNLRKNGYVLLKSTTDFECWIHATHLRASIIRLKILVNRIRAFLPHSLMDICEDRVFSLLGVFYKVSSVLQGDRGRLRSIVWKYISRWKALTVTYTKKLWGGESRNLRPSDSQVRDAESADRPASKDSPQTE
jgi:Exostosin family